MKGGTKQKLLLIVNLLLFICLMVQLVTALGFVFGFAGAGFWAVHKYSGFILFILVLFHLILNFSWIKGQFRKKK